VEPVVVDIKEALEREEMAEHAVGWGIICSPTPAIRRMLIVGVGIAIAQQAVGIDAIQYYLLDVLAQSGIDSETKQNVILIFLGLIKLCFIIVGGKLFDRKGRRPLFFFSLLGMAASLAVISIAFFVNDRVSAGFIATGLGFYLAFFSTGMGPGAWLIPSEVFAVSIRAKAMSVATFSNRVTATLMAGTFLSTAQAMGWGGFFLFLAIVCLIVLTFVYFMMPETKGRSLEDMSVYFAEITGDTFVLEAESAVRRRHGNKHIELPPRDNNGSAPVTDGEVI
jgi:MFS family permease